MPYLRSRISRRRLVRKDRAAAAPAADSRGLRRLPAPRGRTVGWAIRHAEAINALTGSILVEHDASLDELIQQLEHRDVLELDNSEPEHYLATLHRALAESNRRLEFASKGKLDLETISFFGFVGAGIYQCFNNHGLPAGVTLFRYAVELVTSTAIDQARSAIANLPSAQATPKA
jgi:hypothetical protein